MIRKNHQPNLKSTTVHLYDELQGHEAHTPEYAAIVNQIEKLTMLKTQTRRHWINPDTLVIVAGNLACVLVIVHYEQLNVVTSKAMSLVRTIR